MSMRKAIADYVREVVAAYDGLSDITVVDGVPLDVDQLPELLDVARSVFGGPVG